jgi:hypothetical protein
MKLETAIRWRVALAFLVILILIALYVPAWGIPLAILWGGIVLWQLWREKSQGG